MFDGNARTRYKADIRYLNKSNGEPCVSGSLGMSTVNGYSAYLQLQNFE